MSAVTTPVRIRVEPECAADNLHRIRDEIVTANGELVLDFSLVEKVNSSSLREMELLALAAKEKNATIAIRGASVELYKVLKLARLTEQFKVID